MRLVGIGKDLEEGNKIMEGGVGQHAAPHRLPAIGPGKMGGTVWHHSAGGTIV